VKPNLYYLAKWCDILCTYIQHLHRLFLVTPFDEAYEVRYAVSNEQESYQSEAIPILFRKEDHENDTESTISAKEYSIHGNIPGTVDDNFPEISRDTECI